MKQLIALVFYYFIVCVVAQDYPSELPKCKFEDKSCLNEAVSIVLSENPKGHKGLHLLPFDPLRIKTMEIQQSPKSPVNIQLKFTDIDLKGISGAKVYKTVGFNKDPDNSKFEVYAKIPTLSFVGPYKIKGQILVIPIIGNGHSSISFENVNVSLKFIPKIYEKNGFKYMEATKLKFDMKPSKMVMNFENLFNGDPVLSNQTNTFLNENWKDIFGELKGNIVKAIGDILQHVINGPFSNFPYENLFVMNDNF